MLSYGSTLWTYLGRAPAGRWKLWALAAIIALIAGIGTWFAGQYQIGRLDTLKGNYEQPVANFAKNIGNAPVKSLERQLLEDCKQAQIGSWLQTTDALRFDGPLTGNRIDIRLDNSKAFLDLNGKEIATCIQDEVEDRQFDIGSMTNTWAILLLLLAFCLGIWSWICYIGAHPDHESRLEAERARNVYAQTLAETEQKASNSPETGTSDTTGDVTHPAKESHD
ncbi:MAG: hypothetical protein WC043_08915 [Pseudobdellovibrionaceae bacterium]